MVGTGNATRLWFHIAFSLSYTEQGHFYIERECQPKDYNECPTDDAIDQTGDSIMFLSYAAQSECCVCGSCDRVECLLHPPDIALCTLKWRNLTAASHSPGIATHLTSNRLAESCFAVCVALVCINNSILILLAGNSPPNMQTSSPQACSPLPSTFLSN